MTTIRERKKLRDDLLIDLYDNYFLKNGVPLTLTREELSTNKEKNLAYQYLEDKGLIIGTRQGSQTLIKPTVIGIDYVEGIHPKRLDADKEPNGIKYPQENPAKGYIEW